MFKLLFGIIWTVLCVVILIAMQGAETKGDGEASIVVIVLVVFIIVGVFLILMALKKIIADMKTSIKGFETYAIVTGIGTTGTRINNNPVYKVETVVIEENGLTGIYSEEMGMNYNKYRVGEYLRVKHYDADINILGKVNVRDVPPQVREKLECESGLAIGMAGTYGYMGDMGAGYGRPVSSGYEEAFGANYVEEVDNGYVGAMGNGYGNTMDSGYDYGQGVGETVIIDGVEYVRKN